jgi:uncharacterized protein YukE
MGLDPNVITYNHGAIEQGTSTLASASAALAEAQQDLVNINNLLASAMHGQFHASYQEAMLNIEKPLMHLAETVGMHGQVLNRITADAMALDASLAAG